MTTVVKGIVNLMVHFKCMIVVVEAVTAYLDHIATDRCYGALRPGRDKIVFCLRNHSAKQITLPKLTAVREITATNVIPALLALKPTEDDSHTSKTTTQKRKSESQKELLDKIDLTGLRDWNLYEQKEAQELITEYASIFSISYIDLGKRFLVKHSSSLTDNIPFKEHY